MASYYYLNDRAQNNGDHEVHREGCGWMPAPENRRYLGEFDSCHGAVVKAGTYHGQVNGCVHCSTACHTG
jgi:hypothetical protein